MALTEGSVRRPAPLATSGVESWQNDAVQTGIPHSTAPHVPPMNSSVEATSSVCRTFRDLSQEEMSDVEMTSMLGQIGGRTAFGWDALLKSQRVLIISEAGAGKTYECRAQQQALWDQGVPAFYLELAELANNSLRDLLSAAEEERLNAWLSAQSDVASFFLDSIDELKLTLGSFETALRRLSKAISGQLSRVQIVITTRPIALDLQLIQRHLPVPEPVELSESADAFADIVMGRHKQHSDQVGQTAPPVWRNVALMPLSDDQIREMAAIQGIENPETLLVDIRKRNAQDFARRPQDLIELCADWREHRRIRTHHEQVAHDIQVKLKPRTDRREPAQLSPDKAFEGASRLALAALLIRKLTIRLSVDADRGNQSKGALDPARVLHDWTPEERETLLERPLFGFASYGRVRFHHRSVVEFLAAQRLNDRIHQGMPLKAVKRLLFVKTSQGIGVVRPTMRPVAAWLAASQSSIFSEVREREPEVLLDFADPESLSSTQRTDALRSYVQFYGKGGWRGLRVPYVQVHRFAQPDLAVYVSDLWATGIENLEVRELLLELIGAGPLPACANIAHDVALNGAAKHGERLNAITALARLDDSRVEAMTQSMVDAPALWPDRVLRGAIVRLFPCHITPDRLYEILKRVKESPDTIGELGWVIPHNIAELDFAPGYLEALRARLTGLITEGLVWKAEWPHLLSERPHLLSALAAVCLRQINAGATDTEVLSSSVIALRLRHDERASDEPAQQLRTALAGLSPVLREAIFWIDDAFSEGLHPESDPWRRLVRAAYHGPLDLNYVQDGAWIRQILTGTTRPLPQRTMMLELSMRGIWDGIGNIRDYIEGLRQYVVDTPELSELIDRFLAPPVVNSDEVKLEARINRQRKVAETREAMDHASWVAFWREVAEHPQTAFSPDREGNTAWNLWRAMQRSGNESRASGWNRRFIEKYFGKNVADSLRMSMRSIWRNDKPTLRSERAKEDSGTILIRWQLGLAAIAAEAEDPGWARKLSIEEAELAARYAPIELNGFAGWLAALVHEHPAAVERTLGAELTDELEASAAGGAFGMMLQNVSYSPAEVVQIFLPRLRDWLDAHGSGPRALDNDATAAERLRRVLWILLAQDNEEGRERIRVLADGYLSTANNDAFTQVWLTTLMRLDPLAGTAALERLLAPLTPAGNGPAISLFGVMFGDHSGNLLADLGAPGFTSALLLRLVRLAYQYVRPFEDISHEGTYTPGPRDKAQQGRNAVLKALLDARGAEAWMVKLEMIEDPLFAHFRDRIALLAREKAAEEADNIVLSESEVESLNRYGETPPTTRDEMFSVLVDRLDDLEDLLLQDVSPRDGWAMIQEERVMRQQIALQLHNASNHAYTVDQKAVTADEKETDIRLRVASSGQQGTIELKLGEKWSGRQLRDTIKNQLVTKYMAAESCRSGCLLITVANNRTWEHPETGEKLDIDGLRAMLDAEAGKLVKNMGDTLRLAIKVLDLRPRLISEAKLKAKLFSTPEAPAAGT
jgi:hypothetical protein